MDELDRALEAAWARVAPRIREDRLEARRRGMRREGKQPVAPWCLCIKASDPRITDYHALIDDREAAAEGRAHTIVLGAQLVRDLCRPVRIAWPGVPRKHAAYRLGISPELLRRWIRRGVVRARRSRTQGGRGWGKYEQHVWTDGPMNPNALEGRKPDAMWGTAWQGLAERIPDDFSITVRRVPSKRFGGIGTSRFAGGRFGGWHFACPGLAGGEKFSEADGPVAQTGTCGQRVDKLYIPIPVMTFLAAIGERDLGEATAPLQLPLPEGGGRGVGAPAPNSNNIPSNINLPTLRAACWDCHGVVNGTLHDRYAWNRFISTISGGLLYGREVERPPAFVFTRRKRPFRHPTRVATQRNRILELWLSGRSYPQIAAALKTTPGNVKTQMGILFKTHGVHNRAQLSAKLGDPLPPGTPSGEARDWAGGYRLPARVAQVLKLMQRGLANKDIAATMGILRATVREQQGTLYRLYRVHSRQELLARVEALRRVRVKGVLEGKKERGLRLVG